MAGLFSLGPHHSKQEQQDQEEHNNNNNNNNIQLLFRNEEIYTNSSTSNTNRGFEIWPHHQPSYYSFGLGPSSNRNTTTATNLNDDVSVSFSDDSNRFGFTVMRSSSSGSGLGSGTNCQDCGNQAKKDCPHLRCRTCCRSRGFQCSTHVKSTWVPAAKRRERQLTLTSSQQQQPGSRGEGGEGERERERGADVHSRRTREATACVPVPITTTGLELGQFPPELNSAALFRCVKVSPMDAPDERYAYQTAVNIGGHVFKGILYDQGPDAPFAGEGSSHGGAEPQPHPHHQQLSLITTTAATTTAAAITFDPSQLYPPPMNAFMAGTQFFPPPRT